ncbi:MAG: hypothetical protein QG622_3755 [Actinomycetota bacterium]|nr:hypothetical protein [Actinomycetota bacterium]
MADPALWDVVRQAALGGRRGAAGVVADLATVDGTPRLGWVLPPPARLVEQRLLEHLDRLSTGTMSAHSGSGSGTGTTVLVGTGGWAFGARAAAGAVHGGRLRVVDVLDPSVLSEPSADAVVAVSESGDTTETRILTSAIAGRWGVEPVRLAGKDLWLDPGAPSVALFSAPSSAPFLLAAAIARSGPSGDRLGSRAVLRSYRRFAEQADHQGEWAAAVSRRIPRTRCRILLRLPPDAGEGLRLFTLQLLRQGLGGKLPEGGPWWDVVADGSTPYPAPAPASVLRLPGTAPHTDPLTRLMLRCHAIAALVACVGARQGVRFAEHPAVAGYKRLLGRDLAVLDGTETGRNGTEPDGPMDVVREVSRWARARRGLTRAHLVCYDPRLTLAKAPAADQLTAATGLPWEVHPGSSWNHHSYQAVSGEPDLGVVAIAPAPADRPESDAGELIRVQAELAAATCASLGDRALLLRTARPALEAPKEPMPS